MTGNTSKEDRLRDYLLGRLSESEQKRLERRLLLEDRLFQMGETLARGPGDLAALEADLRSLEGAADEEVEEREQAVRAELFDAYARGELGAEGRQWVNRRAEGSDADRERLAFARKLVEFPEIPTVVRKGWSWQAAAGIAATIALVSAVFLGGHFAGWPEPPKPPVSGPAGIGPAPVQSRPLIVDVRWTNTRDAETPSTPIPSAAAKFEFHLHLPSPAADAQRTFRVVILGPDDKPIKTFPELGKDPDQTLHLGAVELRQEGIYKFQVSGLAHDGTWTDLGETQADLGRQ